MSKHVPSICEAKTFRVERTNLEPYTAGNLLDVGVFEARNKQAWMNQLLLDIASRSSARRSGGSSIHKLLAFGSNPKVEAPCYLHSSQGSQMAEIGNAEAAQQA